MNYLNTYSEGSYMNPIDIYDSTTDEDEEIDSLPDLISIPENDMSNPNEELNMDIDYHASVDGDQLSSSFSNSQAAQNMTSLYEQIQAITAGISSFQFSQPSMSIPPPLESYSPIIPEQFPPLPSSRNANANASANSNVNPISRLQPVQLLVLNAFQQQLEREEERQYQQDMERAMQESIQHRQPVIKRVIDDGVFKGLPHIGYTDDMGERTGCTQCPIEMEDFED